MKEIGLMARLMVMEFTTIKTDRAILESGSKTRERVMVSKKKLMDLSFTGTFLVIKEP